jgi:hypothetical protein
MTSSTSDLSRRIADLLKKTSTPKKGLYAKFSNAWGVKDSPALELAVYRLKSIFTSRLLFSYRRLQRTRKRPVADLGVLEKMLCSNCGNRGLQRLTESSKENFTPRLLASVAQLLPQECLVVKQDPWHTRKISGLADISAILIGNSYQTDSGKASSCGDHSENFPVLTENVNRVPTAGRCVGLRVPKLNIHHFTSKPRVIAPEVSRGIHKLQEIGLRRLQVALDRLMVNASSLQSITFELSQESLNIYGDRLTGRFRTSRGEVAQHTCLTATKILASRLDKLVYRRKLQGFYKIEEIFHRG